MTDQDKLKLGIEIVSAMKASSYGIDIEEGRVHALLDTEIDRMEGVTPEYFNNLPEADQKRFREIAEHEKKRLHEQAMFVAGVTLDYLSKNHE